MRQAGQKCCHFSLESADRYRESKPQHCPNKHWFQNWRGKQITLSHNVINSAMKRKRTGEKRKKTRKRKKKDYAKRVEQATASNEPELI